MANKTSFIQPREERLERAKLLCKERDLLSDLIKSGTAKQSHYTNFLDVDEELTQLERINRGETDVMYFALEYFSEDGNPGNDDNLIPSGVDYDNAADFHHELCGLLNDVATDKLDTHVAWACPRRHAKTAYLSNIYLVHRIVYEHGHYTVLVSETTDVAGDFITWGRYQLKFNEKLRKDFGELLHPKATQNALDNKYEFITANNIKVEAKGLGTQMRGLRHGSHRPDLFLLDDLESKESTNTKEQIEKSKAWFSEEMLPALSKDGICVYLGTILAYDSLLDHVIRERRDFKSKKYSAIIEWSKRSDLWDEWRKLYRSDSHTARQDAYNFYYEHQADMLEGTEILWEGYFEYIDLIEVLENSGAKAFNQEYQNNPTDEERQLFKPEKFTFYTPFDTHNKKFDYYAGIDFAMGKERGDFSTIVTIAKNRTTGVCYVVDTYAKRVHPDEFIKAIVEKVFEYQYEAIAVEAQMAQEFFADKLSEELTSKGYPARTRLKKIKQRTKKELRIEALLPDIEAAKIRFHKKHTDLLHELYYFGMTKHDDLADALAMSYAAARTEGRSQVSMARPGYNRW